MSKVLVPLAEGFEEIEAVCIIDILRRGGVEVVTAGVKKRNVTAAFGLSVVADVHLDDVKSSDFDMIALPGGNLGYKNLAQSERVIELLREFDKDKKQIAAICAAPYVLSVAGVLKNSYTCYPSIEQDIQKSSYKSAENVVVDENIITSKGIGTAVEFGLFLLKTLEGKEKSDTVRKAILA